MTTTTLYHYWRSSTSWRVRWALELKNIPYQLVHVNLLNGESDSPEHLARNPLGYVPVLDLNGRRIFESVAIMELLEELHPTPSFLPGDAYQRARVRQLTEMMNSDTTPLQNLTPLEFYSDDPAKRKTWAQHWIHRGFMAYNTIVQETKGRFSMGDHVTMADICLIPQCYNALRQEMDLSRYPAIQSIYEEALKLESCQRAHPDRFKPA